MFDLERVELENFRSYRGKHSFDVPDDPGLYLITGQNQQQPRLGSNDVGKSTLLDAIYWCLYGKTTRGLKAGDVITWGESTCSVTVELWIGDLPVKFQRTQNPNSLKYSNGLVAFHPVSQEDVEKRLRLGPEAFTYAVLLPQFGKSFFDLLPSDKLTLFSQIMGLDLWLDKSREAEELDKDILDLIKEKKQAVIKAKTQIETTVGDIENLGKQHLDFDREKARSVAKLKKVLEEVSRPDPKGRDFAERALANIARKLAKIGATNEKCPTCGQKVANKDIEALLQNRSDWERELAKCEQQEATYQTQRRHLGEAIQAEVKRTNPYMGLITAKKDAMATAKEDLDKLNTQIERLDKDHIAVNFWISGFKRVRLFLVEQTLRQLEVEVNNNMASLGLTDWRIEFDVERENKSGGITKGFTVFIYSPEHNQPVRWEAWAGGVSQRLRLAGDLGLANLIMERAGLTSKIEFYDEPSRHLSQEGLLDVAETLHQRALTDGKRIFLVDHQSIDFGDFAGLYFITKTANGSCIER